MPVQAAQWTEFLSCPICYHEFDGGEHQPTSLGCSHTVCKTCLHKLHRKACPFDQTPISTDIDLLPVNCALLQLVGAQAPEVQPVSLDSPTEVQSYEVCRVCVEELALYLKPLSAAKGVASACPGVLSRPMQRKLVTLVNCQLVEEEGRVRAVRAGRSLGERTVTELILQHQNSQQLSANLWAAVRARGCQFLGPAMQEDALKLVLLALEDGSALSRKVLVLFVVQKLEARFPQASKTSIGHVVQLLYRASCFKVTKRDEDSSLMQLKEEFRTYEALRREHDAQIVHIAMEAGLRISPEQWSSLLYGDLVHKSHMQSIIDKLQSPESFAKSVQELTIVLQRTGDPANLTSLRPHLELLANIDHNPDAPAPSWDELEGVMLAVKLVVHGLVEFIQNFSKKNHDAPQPQPNSKYKTSMCRDLRLQSGCPRGGSCTFAHTQDELERFRLRNKKSGAVGRVFPPGKTLALEAGLQAEAAAGAGQGPKGDHAAVLVEVVSGGTEHKLTSRGADAAEDVKRAAPDGSGGQAGKRKAPTERSCASPPRTPVSHSSPLSPLATAGWGDGGAALSKHGAFLLRTPHLSQAAEVYYQEPHPVQEPGRFPPGCESVQAPTTRLLFTLLTKAASQFLRSSNVPESSLPPSASTPPSFPGDPHGSSQPGYPPRERMGPPSFHAQPRYGPLVAAHGVYAPLYDSRRVWRPQLYHREDARSNSLPLEVLHSSVYQPPLRERFNSLDSNYCPPKPGRACTGLNAPFRPRAQDYGHVRLGYEDLFRRRQEQWAHHHSANRPSQSSPIYTVDFGSEPAESGGGQCAACGFRGEDNLAHYSPWSCGTIGPCLRPFDPETLNPKSAPSCAEHPELDGNGGGDGKRWLPSLDHYRRLKDEDPIIPFSEAPIISKWGAISRAARAGYHATDPIQATVCKGGAGTAAVTFKDYNPHLDHGDSRWSSRGSASSGHSGFPERYR
uniref:RING-type E3 ubiquitin transferase n=1 Tax=Tetraodon nigroviridis TaxID=99883 RepID=H3CH79_TETNG